MMTSSNRNIFRVAGPLCGEFTGPGEFAAQRPVTRSFDVFFDLRLNKRLSKQPWGWWFETPPWSLWRHCNDSKWREIPQISVAILCNMVWTHWGRVTLICVNKLTTIGSDNGLSPGRRQAIISTIARMLLIVPLGTNFSEILIEIPTFSFKKMRLKMSSEIWRLFCIGLNVLIKTNAKPLLPR